MERKIPRIIIGSLLLLLLLLSVDLSEGAADSVYGEDTSSMTVDEILLTLFTNTRGLRWTNRDNWLQQDVSYCSWHGITCFDAPSSEDERYQQIQTLDLSDNLLFGNLPSEVYEIPYLEVLNLAKNPNLHINPGANLERAQHLTDLVLSNTDTLSLGGINKAAASLENLQIAQLNLNGQLPPLVWQMTKLTTLNADSNSLDGSIPSSITSLAQLEEFSARNNQFAGQIPTQMGELTRLKVLRLDDNDLTGSIPDELASKCTHLQILSIAQEDGTTVGSLAGPLPSFNAMENLLEVDLKNNGFTGSIPSNFLAADPADKVITVDLSGNALTGAVPQTLARLKRLELSLQNNQIDDIEGDLCNDDIGGWFGGAVGSLGCDAFLCPPNTFAPQGRATSSESCRSCSGNPYYGMKLCHSQSGSGNSAGSTDGAVNARSALITLYNSMGGRFWTNNDNWLNPAVSVCDWHGVTCSNGVVTGLNLKENNVGGRFPTSAFASFPDLTLINLSGNSVGFRFEGISEASNLEILDLTHTQLDSLDNIGDLADTNIQVLKLDSNFIQGSLPNALFDLRTLEDLSISHNRLDGPIPTAIGQLVNLQRFRAYGCGLEDAIPTQIGLLVNLRVLDLAENKIDKPLPTQMNNLVNLQSLSLHQTTDAGIMGPLPSFRDLAQLTSLQMDSNRLMGNLPDDFLINTRVGDERMEIRLSDNWLMGDIPDSWVDRFDNLFLDLTGNRITGIPERVCTSKPQWMDGAVGEYNCDSILCPRGTWNEFGRQAGDGNSCRQCDAASSSNEMGRKFCTADDYQVIDGHILEDLYYSCGGASWKDSTGWITSTDYCNDWTGVSCNAAGKVTKLVLSDNGLTGTIKSSLFSLTELRELDLQKNKIRVDFTGIEQATQLTTLHLSNTNLDNVDGLGKATSLRFLHLTDNDLAGPIPSDLYRLTNIRNLYLNYNKLSGRIFPDVAAWTNLEELYLLHNQLTGQIPASIGSLNRLRVLSLSENRFTGSLPVELGDLEAIQVLAIQRETDTTSSVNSHTSSTPGIQGRLPPLDKLKNVRELYLGENSLTGPIPSNFLDGIDDKGSQITVDLASNQLTGSVPASLVQFQRMNLYLYDNEIKEIADGLCAMSQWMSGEVDQRGCDAFLCQPGFFNEYGRFHLSNSPCRPCPSGSSAPFYGAIECVGAGQETKNDEREILMEFFTATQGDSWSVSTGWGTSEQSICRWHGITCTSDADESVATIQLSKNGLGGTIPTSIYDLPNLSQLTLSDNEVTMDFGGIGSASSLEVLNIEKTFLPSNGLNGLQNADNLVGLNLAGNLLSDFPSEVLQLGNLDSLTLSENPISSLPTDFGSLDLTAFTCDACGLAGSFPAVLTTMLRLKTVSLKDNSLTGSIPVETEVWTALEKIDLSNQASHGGGLTGVVDDFATFVNLVEIRLSGNSFTGAIPTSFLLNAVVANHITVDLRDNGITGAIPASLARFQNMELLLANNRITSVPTEICSTMWNDGSSSASCDHILCAPGTWNSLGRATSDIACATCDLASTSTFFGMSQCGDNPEEDILNAMYADLNGAAWTKRNGWTNPGFPVCTWYGITCHTSGAREGTVQSIQLPSNNMRGSLASTIWGLRNLETINVKENQVSFSFAGIDQAASLKVLQVSETNVQTLTGISSASDLRELHLTNNKIGGAIPTEIFSVTTLEKLYLNYNEFSGGLSPLVSQLVNLQEFYLFHNKLNGFVPDEIGRLQNLEVLGLGENLFEGPVPTAISSLINLRILSLQKETTAPQSQDVDDGEGLNGSLPSFSNLKKLKELYLGGNKIAGSIPTNFLSGIEETSGTITIDLALNQLTGTIPTGLARFNDLRLYLAGNEIRSVPGSICAKTGWMDGLMATDCDALLCPPGTYNDFGRRINKDAPCVPCAFEGSTQFYGSVFCGKTSDDQNLDDRAILFRFYNELDGDNWLVRDNWKEDSTSVCSWAGVTCESEKPGSGSSADIVVELELPNNNLKGAVPPLLFHLTGLKKLNLQENDVELTFGGVGLTPNLEDLNFAATRTTVLDGIGDFTNLQSLRMEDNALGQTLPTEIFELTSLRRLIASISGLYGSLASEIGQLSRLSELFINGNDFSGELPTEIGRLTDLSILQLSENSFFGTIPTQVSRLTALKTFFADSFTRFGAGFSGPLPSFSRHPDLRELYIGSNTLTGPIPDDFLEGITTTTETITIGLRSNKISGTIPGFLSRFDSIDIDMADNQIEAIDASLCSKDGWMEGDVRRSRCDAILCPMNTWNEIGRESSAFPTCLPCESESGEEMYLGSTYCAAAVKKQETDILTMFYQSLNGRNWKKQDGWMSDNDICTWQGVACNSRGEVDSLLLGANNLAGDFPREVWTGLRSLTYLWLYSNPINFSFDGIVGARKLESLLVDSTGLTSLEGIGGATALTDLDVRFNSLAGQLPNEIKNLKDLVSFACSSNALTGTVPSFATNRKLTTLRMGTNDFHGTLPDFAGNVALSTLDLSQNRLYGSIPTTLFQELTSDSEIFLDLSDNDLTGTLPGTLARFDKARIFIRDNLIEELDPKLCSKNLWLEGDVGTFGCDGLACPPGKFAQNDGRATRSGGSSSQCQPCEDNKYFGGTACGFRPHVDSSSPDRRGVGVMAVFCAVVSAAVIHFFF